MSSGAKGDASESLDDITHINLDDLFSGKECGSPKSKQPARRTSSSGKKSARKRKPMKRLSIPLEQLLNGDDPWTTPAPTPTASPTPTALALTEARIKNYMNDAFGQLKEDFSFHLTSLLEETENTTQLVDGFIAQFVRELKTEIVMNPEPLALPEIEFPFDVALPVASRRSFPSVRHLVSEFSARKVIFPQSFETKRQEMAKEMIERDAAQKEADAALKRHRHDVNKLRRHVFELEARAERRNAQRHTLQNERRKLEQQIEDFESAQARASDDRSALLELKDEFAQLARDVTMNRATSLTQRMMTKLGTIVDESVDLRSVRQALVQSVFKVSEAVKMESQFGVLPPRRAGTPPAGRKSPFVDLTNQIQPQQAQCDEEEPSLFYDFRMDQRFSVPLASYA